MKRIGCEHENSVIQAMRTGEWTGDLRTHAAECAECGEALRVARALRQEARRAELQCDPPDAHWILQRARRRAREIAVRRVTRGLSTARAIAAIYAFGAMLWFLRGYASLSIREVTLDLHGTFVRYALMGAVVSAICAAAGLWPLLRGGAPREGL